MYAINRTAVIIKLKQAMLDWINYTDIEHKFTMEEISCEHLTFLIPDFDYSDDAWKYIEMNYKQIFKFALFGWYTDEALWPKRRTYKMFNEWFDVQINSEVFDLVDEKIDKEEM